MSRHAVLTFLGLIGTVAFAVPSAQSAIIYGINGQDNKVYGIDTTNGSAVEVGGAYTIPGDASPNAPNGLAFDTSGNRFYFTSGDSANPDRLYRATPNSTTVQDLGSLGTANVWSGAYGNGNYYYWTETGALRVVSNINSVDSAATVTSQPVAMVPDLGSNPTFGDVVVRGTTLYASYGGVSDGNSGASFAVVDLTTGTTQTFGNSRRMQLAFAGNDLFGLVTSTDTIFKVDVTDGSTSGGQVLQNASLFSIADAATVPLPAAAWLFGSAFLGLCWLGRRAGTRGVGMLPAG